METRILAASAAIGLAASLFVKDASSSGAALKPGPKTPAAKMPAAPKSVSGADPFFARAVQPLLKQYCVPCHSGSTPSAGLALDKLALEDSALRQREIWEKVSKNLRNGSMPPPGMPKPPDADRSKMADWLDGRLNADACQDPPNPGRVTLRRLNRAEYQNTIRDLTGVRYQADANFPADDVGYGFDNNGDVLSLPPLLMEKYLSAAETIVAQAYPRLVPKPPADLNARHNYARRILLDFAGRAFRRPLSTDEKQGLYKLFLSAESQEKSFDQGLKIAFEAVLLSPNFLFRVERNKASASSEPYRIGDYELASRLSYFLWSSMPDETLLKLAGKGTLRQPAVLQAQVLRMLKSPKANAGLADNFEGQWLQTRRMKTAAPDPTLFPKFNDRLRADMLTETQLFFEAVMREDRSVLDFLDGNYTYVNERMAKLYGIPGVKGPAFRKVKLDGKRRGGVLTQASILTFTSNPTRTSPVKRGKWVLEEFLNAAPPPPPPGVNKLNEDHKVVASAPFRVRMAQHRADPHCAVCHTHMDPIGFSLENFDAIGAWRTQDGRFKIDASGKFPDGTSFNGPSGLRKVLLGQKKEFARCLTEKMLTFALGRGLESYDRCAVDRIVARLAKSNYKFSSLVIGIAESDPFQMRNGEGAKI
jgi:hypothetical protein